MIQTGYSVGDEVAYRQDSRSNNFAECEILEIDLGKPIPFKVKDVKTGDILVLRDFDLA